jgi:hypothetical protein
MPARFVTSSIVKPDSASYILGQPLNVPVQKGDALLWSQFEQMPSDRKAPVLVAKGELAAGTVLTADSLEELQVPEALATGSVVKPVALSSVVGTRLTAPMKKGDLLLWSQVEKQKKSPGPLPSMWGPKPGLTMDEIMAVMTAHHAELSACTALGQPHRTADLDLMLVFSVSPDGVPNHVTAPNATDLVDSPIMACVVKALAGWTFPKRKEPTLGIEFPIRVISR